MPYVVCPGCDTRSYVAPRAPRTEPCPVCGIPLRADGTPAGERERSRSDADLTCRHRGGDPDAFALLHDRYAAELLAHARRLVGPSVADDVVQEAFEQAHHLLLEDSRARTAEFSLRAWLHRVVRNRCVDELRRVDRRPSTLGDVVAARVPEPLELVVARDRLTELTSAVRALPIRQREALVRHVLDGQSHEQVARGMAVSVAATKCLVNRARVELRHSTAA